uniref:Histone-binding protein RBBP4-like N-terminal domain-containing protein n=1 Tax=Brassica oleracea TaxID=3712 RepID=A0A3P6F7V6_BRAOL|nr:unnamed protein product [Brassica oleracea]
MILGTHTSENEPNYLMIAQVQLPLDDTESEARQYDDERSEFGGFGCATGKVQIIQQINHEGEVNRARYMPQNPFVIATKTVNAEVKFKAGHLLSGSDDAQICLWDINATPKNKVIDAQQIFKILSVIHVFTVHLFGTVGDDQYLLIWDLRSPSASKPIQSVVAHSMEVLCNELNFKSREGSPITEVEPYIPFNINPAGMQPVLTTTYLLAFPSILASIVGSPFLLHVKDILNPESTVGAPPWVYYFDLSFFVFLFNIFDIVSVTYSFFFSA